MIIGTHNKRDRKLHRNIRIQLDTQFEIHHRNQYRKRKANKKVKKCRESKKTKLVLAGDKMQVNMYVLLHGLVT